ncbi:hypothetical protein RWV98_17715 [Agathobaculum sp. NTUH-O15-33]|uniref:hypothetical protein n=1 Tax=Agathobaculum sp. NTUH-O15-33 TaxID=3079302 RepID=UPI002958BBD7|nr:hypothetical protein [Agathobaculum sp. NTUH-O15-33]WNX84388.1 hypothetical protein RWV98_17715 [Agathobaculum sp. NTUH-O15-33]
MNSIAIEVKVSPELVQALNNLAGALGAAAAQPVPAVQQASLQPVQASPIAPAPAPVSVAAPAAPVQPAPVQTNAPLQTSPVVTGPAATVPLAAAPSFTLEQVGAAGAELIREHPDKMPELLALLQQFSVPAVQSLKPEQVGQFATALRGLGARI